LLRTPACGLQSQCKRLGVQSQDQEASEPGVDDKVDEEKTLSTSEYGVTTPGFSSVLLSGDKTPFAGQGEDRSLRLSGARPPESARGEADVVERIHAHSSKHPHLEQSLGILSLLSTQAELTCDCGIHDPGNEAVEREFAQIMGELAACGKQ